MASLVPWDIRTRPNRYLSFLPMSHVVEGILGTYSPYDLPAPVDVTFLEDFRRVAGDVARRSADRLLLRAPRCTRRCGRGSDGAAIGARYQRMREGPLRGLLRPVVRRAMLRRAGLDRCAQLLVGSAPVDEQLLRSFRELGVEIHVAYGLTEAPLVALNRLGRNHIGTVGELLPETQVRLADDGELLVRGPQVTAGYVDEDEQPFRDGWLLTGDLGHVTRDGWLVIDGRKKDLLKTAYGKYLQPSKIEAMLRRIPGVSEAMVVGEGRPFCAALLWVEGIDDAATVDAAVTDDEPAAVASRAGEAVGGAPERPLDRGRGAHREPQAQAPRGGGEVPRRDRVAVRGASDGSDPGRGRRGGAAMSLRLRALELHVPDVRGAIGPAPALRRDGVRVRPRARGRGRAGSPGAPRAVRVVHDPMRRAGAGATTPISTPCPAACGRTRTRWASRSVAGSASARGPRRCGPPGSPTG